MKTRWPCRRKAPGRATCRKTTTSSLLPPDTFIEAIERAGGIAHLTRWMLAEAVRHCAAWRAKGVNVGIAVNISVDDLVDEYLPYFLLDIAQRWHADGAAIASAYYSDLIHQGPAGQAVMAELAGGVVLRWATSR